MSIATIKLLFSFIFSFLISFYLVPCFCSLAKKLQFVDKPDGKIKQHLNPTPYLGGVAVYCGFLCGVAFTMPFENQLFLLIIGTTLLLLLGLVDDLFELKPYQKFFGQTIVALCFLKAGFYLKSHIFYNVWNIPLSLIWILTVINAFNLVDVMDGLATSLAIYATVTLMILAYCLNHSCVLIILSSFLGSLCAFFFYNRPPAQIYLGDAGSLFIGGFLGAIPFLFDWGTHNWYGYLTPPIILGIPLLECVSLIIIRYYKGIPFYQGSSDHFSYYLMKNGWAKNTVLQYILFLSFALGLVSCLFALGFIGVASTMGVGVLFLIVWSIGLQYKF